MSVAQHLHDSVVATKNIVDTCCCTGNCLFNALSDQLYGHQNEHSNIRSKVIDYMRENADYYKMFIDVHPGGGMRRNPKRKNVGAYSSPANIAPPSESDIDRVFQSHLDSMAKGGTYGDNMEISAFSSAFSVDVKIYQRDFAYMISGANPDTVGVREVAHIAYHVGHKSISSSQPRLTLYRSGSIIRLSATLTVHIPAFLVLRSKHSRFKKNRNKRRNWPIPPTCSPG